MNPQQCGQLLAAYLLDELDARTRGQMETALAADASLRDRLADMRLAMKFVRQGLEEEDAPRLSEARRAALLSAVTQSEPSPVIRVRPWWNRSVPWMAVAASVLVMVGIGLVVGVSKIKFGMDVRQMAHTAVSDARDETLRRDPSAGAPVAAVGEARHRISREAPDNTAGKVSGRTGDEAEGVKAGGELAFGGDRLKAAYDLDYSRSLREAQGQGPGQKQGQAKDDGRGRGAQDNGKEAAAPGGNLHGTAGDTTFDAWARTYTDGGWTGNYGGGSGGALPGGPPDKDAYALRLEAGQKYYRDGNAENVSRDYYQKSAEFQPHEPGMGVTVRPSTPFPAPARPGEPENQRALSLRRPDEPKQSAKGAESPTDALLAKALEGRTAEEAEKVRAQLLSPLDVKKEGRGYMADDGTLVAGGLVQKDTEKRLDDMRDKKPDDRTPPMVERTSGSGQLAKEEEKGKKADYLPETGLGNKIDGKGNADAGGKRGPRGAEQPSNPAQVSALPVGSGSRTGPDARDLVTKVSDLNGPGIALPATQAASAPPSSGLDHEQSLPPASIFREAPVNPWVMTERDRFSTFASDVDSASYALCRAYLRSGYLPPRGAVRMEEFVNAFDYNYPRRAAGVFNVFAQAAPAPFAQSGEDTTLLKIGVQGRVVGCEGRKLAHLVFVVDTSGSMATPDRLPLVQESLKMLVGALGPNDCVSLVTYSRQASLLLEAVPVSRREDILAAVDKLRAGGPTNLLTGLEAGYDLARREFVAGRINRVILCSDGAANIGQTDSDVMVDRVGGYRRHGITLTVAGFGRGGYNDELMETLAKRGDGSYLFIDSHEQARQVFVEKMSATLQTIALDAKIQVEFDPSRVRRYRLIGYEKRAIADEDFRNDAVVAAEVGSGQSSTALYEVELTGERGPQAGPLGTVYVRYRDPDTRQVEEIAHRLDARILASPSVEDDPRFYLAAAAGRFAEILRESPHAKSGTLDPVDRVMQRVVRALPLDDRAAELLSLIRRAKDLPRAP